MIIELPRQLEDEIKKFCEVNNVTEYNNFFVSCIRNGFNIAKYGFNPMDNFRKENKPFKIDEIDIRPKEEDEPIEKGESNRSDEEKENVKPKKERENVIKQKKTIKVIKK